MVMSTALMTDVWMSAEQWGNDTDRGKPKHSKQTLSKHLFVHQSHSDCPGMKHGSLQQVLRHTHTQLTTWVTAVQTSTITISHHIKFMKYNLLTQTPNL
jgi:hypothetical protein